MIEIAFLFRSFQLQRGFGKIKLRYYNDDHDGLDQEVRPYVIDALRSYYTRYPDKDHPTIGNIGNIENISLSIIGTSTEWTSDHDHSLFDLYINCMDQALRHQYYTYLGKSRYLYRDEDYIENDDEDDDDKKYKDEEEEENLNDLFPF